MRKIGHSVHKQIPSKAQSLHVSATPNPSSTVQQGINPNPGNAVNQQIKWPQANNRWEQRQFENDVCKILQLQRVMLTVSGRQ